MNFIEKHITTIVIIVAFASAFYGYFFYHQSQINREVALYVSNSSLTANLGQLAVLPTATPELPTNGIAINGEAPKVESSTHPDTIKWYSNNNPEFQWILPSNATGVSYLISDKATGNPGPKSDGLVSEASFIDIADGTQYFNIKFKEKGVWGLITHYQFNIDTVPPESFSIQTVGSDSIHPEIIFETTDALSGVDHYEIKIEDSDNWNIVSTDQANKPYRLSFNRSGTQTVFVKAVDMAGNDTIESISIKISGLTITAKVILVWFARVFDTIVYTVSAYALMVAFLVIFIGVLVLIFKFLANSIDRLYHYLDHGHPVIKEVKKPRRRKK